MTVFSVRVRIKTIVRTDVRIELGMHLDFDLMSWLGLDVVLCLEIL